MPPRSSTFARVVSKCVLFGTTSPGANHRREQDVLGRAPLVCRDDVGETGDVAHRTLEDRERARAGVRLVSLHHPRPLVHRHGARARVGEQVDQDVLRLEEEHVVMRFVECRCAFVLGRLADRLDGLDAKRLDDRLEFHDAFITREVAPSPAAPLSGSSGVVEALTGSNRAWKNRSTSGSNVNLRPCT